MDLYILPPEENSGPCVWGPIHWSCEGLCSFQACRVGRGAAAGTLCKTFPRSRTGSLGSGGQASGLVQLEVVPVC